MCSHKNQIGTAVYSSILPNVRRYVQLAQSRGGACFCTRGAMQDYDGYYFILALAKTVTPVGDPGGSRGGPYRLPLSQTL